MRRGEWLSYGRVNSCKQVEKAHEVAFNEVKVQHELILHEKYITLELQPAVSGPPNVSDLNAKLVRDFPLEVVPRELVCNFLNELVRVLHELQAVNPRAALVAHSTLLVGRLVRQRLRGAK